MLVRTAVQLLAGVHVLTGKTLLTLGLRPQPDGWRRVVGVGLRNEASKFGLSAFGLTPPTDGVIPALARFLRSDPEARYALRHTPRLTSRYPTEWVDVVELRFAPDGSLTEVEPHLDPLGDIHENVDREQVGAAVVAAYNQTRSLPEAMRPTELERIVRRELADAPEAKQYVRRLLAASCVSVESSTRRFAPPGFRTRRGLGFGHLTFVVRSIGDAVDVWALAHHTGTDGAPLQEMMTRLEHAWGTEPVAFPDPDEFAVEPRACHLPGEREAYESTSFHDFADLMALRKRVAAEQGAAVSFGCLLLSLLHREPEFAGVKFGTTVDIPASGRSERDVDLVTVNPADFADRPDGLAEMARAYTAAVAVARARTSGVRRAMATAELLPPWLHRRMLELNPRAVADTFGAVGVSILKDAKVFVAPFSDLGFPGGFVAVGGIGLPTATGRTVGAVHAKGTRDQVAKYPEVIRRALVKLARREVVAA